MSVLYDALKKVENRENKRHVVEEPVAIKAPAVQARSKDGPGDSTRVLAGAIVVAALVAAAVYVFQTGLPAGRGSDDAVPAEKGAAAHVSENSTTTAEVTPGAAAGTTPAASIATPVIDPKKEALLFNKKGMELFKRTLYLDAILEFKEAVNLDPTNPEPHNNLGLAYLWLGQRSEGESAFKKAIAINPGYPEALNNYGALLDRYWPGKRDKEASALFKKAMRFDSSYADPYFNLAIMLERQGKYSEAAKQYDGFLKKGGGDAEFNKIVKKKAIVLRSSQIY